jgi:hypothetical protein
MLRVSVAEAMVVIWDEATDGDLFDTFLEIPIGFGASIARGTIGESFPGAVAFSVKPPRNGILESVELSLTNSTGGNGLFPQYVGWHYREKKGLPDVRELQDVSAGGDFLKVFGFRMDFLFTSLNPPDGVINDYQYTFNVRPVPLPAALPLFMGAMTFLGLFGWRRKQRVAV